MEDHVGLSSQFWRFFRDLDRQEKKPWRKPRHSWEISTKGVKWDDVPLILSKRLDINFTSKMFHPSQWLDASVPKFDMKMWIWIVLNSQIPDVTTPEGHNFRYRPHNRLREAVPTLGRPAVAGKRWLPRSSWFFLSKTTICINTHKYCIYSLYHKFIDSLFMYTNSEVEVVFGDYLLQISPSNSSAAANNIKVNSHARTMA